MITGGDAADTSDPNHSWRGHPARRGQFAGTRRLCGHEQHRLLSGRRHLLAGRTDGQQTARSAITRPLRTGPAPPRSTAAGLSCSPGRSPWKARPFPVTPRQHHQRLRGRPLPGEHECDGQVLHDLQQPGGRQRVRLQRPPPWARVRGTAEGCTWGDRGRASWCRFDHLREPGDQRRRGARRRHQRLPAITGSTWSETRSPRTRPATVGPASKPRNPALMKNTLVVNNDIFNSVSKIPAPPVLSGRADTDRRDPAGGLAYVNAAHDLQLTARARHGFGQRLGSHRPGRRLQWTSGPTPGNLRRQAGPPGLSPTCRQPGDRRGRQQLLRSRASCTSPRPPTSGACPARPSAATTSVPWSTSMTWRFRGRVGVDWPTKAADLLVHDRDSGPDPAASMTLTFSLPSGVRYISSTAPGDWTVTAPAGAATSGTVTFTLNPGSSLATGQSASFTVTRAIGRPVPAAPHQQHRQHQRRPVGLQARPTTSSSARSSRGRAVHERRPRVTSPAATPASTPADFSASVSWATGTSNSTGDGTGRSRSCQPAGRVQRRRLAHLRQAGNYPASVTVQARARPGPRTLTPNMAVTDQDLARSTRSEHPAAGSQPDHLVDERGPHHFLDPHAVGPADFQARGVRGDGTSKTSGDGSGTCGSWPTRGRLRRAGHARARLRREGRRCTRSSSWTRRAGMAQPGPVPLHRRATRWRRPRVHRNRELGRRLHVEFRRRELRRRS